MKALFRIKLIYHLLLLSCYKICFRTGENFKILIMVLKLKIEGIIWTAFQFFFRFDLCKIPKFRRRSTGKADYIFQNLPGVGVFLSRGPCFCRKILPWAGLLTTSKNFLEGFARGRWGCLRLELTDTQSVEIQPLSANECTRKVPQPVFRNLDGRGHDTQTAKKICQIHCC